MLHYLLTILFLFYQPTGSNVSVRLLVPQAVRAGSSTILVCQFDLHGQQLYSVKWYRGNFEFFRFIPKDAPAGKSFKFPGLDVDVSSSSAHQVVLLRISEHVGGRFSCEVSAEGPRFTTSSDYAELHVIDVKRMSRPEIHLSSNFYDTNHLDRLSINCTSHPTLPPPTINFFINNSKMKAEFVDIINSGLATLSSKSLEPFILFQYTQKQSTESDRQFITDLTDRSRQNQVIKSDLDQPLWIRCEATLPQVYQFSSSDVPLFPQIDDPDEAVDKGISYKSNHIIFTIIIIMLLLNTI